MSQKIIAIDLGATKLKTALIDKKGKILEKIVIETPKKQKEVEEKLIYLVKKLASEKTKAIGVSAAGFFKKGTVYPSNIPCQKIEIEKTLSSILPVFISNDCAAAAWAEKIYGQGQKYKNIVYLSISSGIGAGVIINNNLLKGNATEVGHFVIDSKYNLPCLCQKGKGHWESYCSGNNIPSFYNLLTKKKIKKAEEVFSLAEKKNKEALNFIEKIGQMNVAGIENIIVAYNPEIIIFGGSVFLKNKKYILPYIKKNKDKYLSVPIFAETDFKENAPLLGAAALYF